MNTVKKKRFVFSAVVSLIIFAVLLSALYKIGIIPHRQYKAEDFKIVPYVSGTDKDGDGTDDQTDILNNVRNYIAEKPKYKSKYYENGYPDDGYGVCTDVVAFGLKNAGYDLMELVNGDILNNSESYNIDTVDASIDFRRVKNLDIYFKNNHIVLTTDLSEINEWQGGDIVVFKKHIGIISDKRNRKGIPFLIHHASPLQIHYEEDALERYEPQIIGHYRIS